MLDSRVVDFRSILWKQKTKGVAVLEIEFYFKLTRKPKAKKITVQAELEQ